MQKQKTHNTHSDKIFNIIVYGLSALILLVVAYPMWFILIASFSEPSAVYNGRVFLWPVDFTLLGYQEIFKRSDIWLAYRNTIAYVIVGTLISLFVNLSAAYALSRKDLVGRKVLTLFFVFTMFFNGGLIPTYLNIQNFGLLNTFTVMVLPFSVLAFHIIVSRTFFQNLPEDLLDAAKIDGCGNLRYYFIIALPLSKAVIAVIGLWTAVGHWNSYFNALIYLPRAPELAPLQLVLRSILVVNQASTMWGGDEIAVRAQQIADLLMYSSIVVSTVPIMLLYPFVQKHFNQGVMIGAIKG